MEQVSTTERRHIDNTTGDEVAKCFVYTPTYTPEAQLQALEHIAQALERVATILIAWDNGARPLSVRVSNLKYF